LIGKNHPLAQAILAAGLSPNALKDLAECPFKIYGRKVLALDPEEKDVERGEITPSASGKIIHEILESFYRSQPARWEDGLAKAAQDVFRTFEKNHPELYPLAWQATQNKILAMLKRFIPLDLAEMKESGFTPKFFETDIRQEIHEQALQGRIDRLDVREGKNPAFRVVDYKTGSGGIGKKEKLETAILKGKNFQLPVYLALAEAWLKGQGIKVKGGSAAFYRLQEDDALEAPLVIDSEFWEEYGDRFYKNLSFLVKDIETGFFYIRPSDSYGYCSWCHFQDVCRKSHKPTQRRSENSSQRKAHEECFKP
jgi:ATP-dependent helicase/DNAse subunit B